MDVGIVGLGRMGSAIGRRLLEANYGLAVWNRTSEKAVPLLEMGAKLAASPRDLAEGADIVLTILTDANAIDSVYTGKVGLLSADVRGKMFVEMSTVQPGIHIALADKVRARQAAFLECPVGGTVGPALSGKLLGFAGGAKEDFDRARPLLEQLCRRVELMGPMGAGSSMKLAINLPLAIFWQSFGEAYALCRHLDVDTSWLVDLFAESSGAPNVLRVRGGAVALALQAQDSGSETFDCNSIRKDLRIMLDEGRRLGFELPLAERALDIYNRASKEGWGGKDCTALPAYCSSAAPLQVIH